MPFTVWLRPHFYDPNDGRFCHGDTGRTFSTLGPSSIRSLHTCSRRTYATSVDGPWDGPADLRAWWYASGSTAQQDQSPLGDSGYPPTAARGILIALPYVRQRAGGVRRVLVRREGVRHTLGSTIEILVRNANHSVIHAINCILNEISYRYPIVEPSVGCGGESPRDPGDGPGARGLCTDTGARVPLKGAKPGLALERS